MPNSGVSLETRYSDVRKLILGFLPFKGPELEDILQDTYLLILERNLGDSRHDPSKSALSNYVRMTLRTVLSNRRRARMALKRGGEGIGAIEHPRAVLVPLEEEGLPADLSWAPDAGDRVLYLRELRARPSCPQDVGEYLDALAITTDSEDLREALNRETIQLTALRRRLIWWLRLEGELEIQDLRPGKFY